MKLYIFKVVYNTNIYKHPRTHTHTYTHVSCSQAAQIFPAVHEKA